VVFRTEHIVVSVPIVSLLMLTIPIPAREDRREHSPQHEQGIHFIREQGAMQGLIILGFCMTAL